MARVDYEFSRGDTFKIEGPATRINPVTGLREPVNLTDVELRFTAKRRITDPDSAAVLRKGNDPTGLSGIEVIDAATGYYRCTVQPDDTDELEDETVYLTYDIQLLEPDGSTSTLQDGFLKVKPDRSRA